MADIKAQFSESGHSVTAVGFMGKLKETVENARVMEGGGGGGGDAVVGAE